MNGYSSDTSALWHSAKHIQDIHTNTLAPIISLLHNNCERLIVHANTGSGNLVVTSVQHIWDEAGTERSTVDSLLDFFLHRLTINRFKNEVAEHFDRYSTQHGRKRAGIGSACCLLFLIIAGPQDFSIAAFQSLRMPLCVWTHKYTFIHTLGRVCTPANSTIVFLAFGSQIA